MRTVLSVDIGGTFVDAVAYDGESNRTYQQKAPTTDDDLLVGVLEAIDGLPVSVADADAFVHGTTIGLNALLERDGAKTGLITNEGFGDVLEIGRAQQPFEERYDVTYQRPAPLVPRRRRLGVPGRLDERGEVVESLDEDAVEEAARRLIEDHGVESVAVSFLHAYQNPAHERRAREVIETVDPSVAISLSSDVNREYREYERTSTTVVDAYVKPMFESYADRLRESLEDAGFDGSFLVARSGGGATPVEDAVDAAVQTVLSGPAGGVMGATRVGEQYGADAVLAMDVGGTSLDVCVVTDGDPEVTYETTLGDLPVSIPVYDVRPVGAGGGSVARADGPLLKVGPESAGSDPGPCCYGWGGTEPTVTDAALVLGYVDPDRFLGGEMALHPDAAREGIRDRLADPLDLSVPDASSGIFEVTLANTVGQLRELTVEKGLDPRAFTVVAYGGAGPMVAPLVARELAVDRVVVPPVPSVFSAWGMLGADVVHDLAETVIEPLDAIDVDDLDRAFDRLQDRGTERLRSAGVPPEERRFERSVEMRYVGQEHTLAVPANDLDDLATLRDRFDDRYLDRFSHSLDNPAEVITLRLRAAGVNDFGIDEGSIPGTDHHSARTEEAYCFATDSFVEFTVVDRADLGPGADVDGPAIVREPTTSTVVHSDQHVAVDDHGNLVVRNR